MDKLLKVSVILFKIFYWILFVWNLITGFFNADTLGGAALMIIAILQCTIALAYDALNEKINNINKNTK